MHNVYMHIENLKYIQLIIHYSQDLGNKNLSISTALPEKRPGEAAKIR